MKRRRTMLLCVTATSMTTAVSCRDPAIQPVGMVAAPSFSEAGAPSGDDRDRQVTRVEDGGRLAEQHDASTTPGSVSPDAGGMHLVVGKVPLHTPDPARVGTTANVPDDFSPTVGTTAHAPDRKK